MSASAAAAGNEDLQGMYERIIGTSNNTAEEKKLGDKRLSGDGTSVMGGTLIHNPTINQQIRNRHIVRDSMGQPLGKVYKNAFKPNNPKEARSNIRNDNFAMH